MSNLSGRAWWNANQARWPDSEDLDDLDSDWGDNVKKFIKIIKEAGAKVRIISTRRPRNRAYLMHYSWMIANGRIEPADVPKRAGINIQWDHGDDKISRKAAQEMFDCFGLAHYAAGKRSNHVKGKAIDMSITWTKDLFLGPLPNGEFEENTEKVILWNMLDQLEKHGIENWRNDPDTGAHTDEGWMNPSKMCSKIFLEDGTGHFVSAEFYSEPELNITKIIIDDLRPADCQKWFWIPYEIKFENGIMVYKYEKLIETKPQTTNN